MNDAPFLAGHSTEKRLNGIIVVVDAIGTGRHRVQLDTIYIKNSHPAVVDAKTPQPLRPEQSAGKAKIDLEDSSSVETVNNKTAAQEGLSSLSNNSIPNPEQTVNNPEMKVRSYNESPNSYVSQTASNTFMNSAMFNSAQENLDYLTDEMKSLKVDRVS